MFLRRRNLAFVAAVLLFTFAAAQGQFESSLPAVDLIFGLLLVVIVLGVILRFGLVAGVAAFVAHFTTIAAPLTLKTTSTYFGVSLTTMLVLAGIAAFGYHLARAESPSDPLTRAFRA